MDSTGCDTEALLRSTAKQVERYLRAIFTDRSDAHDRLAEAMAYSLFAGGKRLRPALVMLTGRMLGATDDVLLPPAAAIECVHTFSLIHDDLPAMDDDDLRRGKPTNHIVFGEAMAILAGDALLALAFEILTGNISEPRMCVAMVRELAEATGWCGMIAGQAADILGEGQQVTPQRVRYIHERKTARLIQAACRLGAIAAKADRQALAAISEYGYHLGLAFQMADDLLDATATAQQVGKRTGKDAAAGKQTAVRLASVEEVRQAAQKETENAIDALRDFGSAAEPLRGIAEFVVTRTD